VARTAAAGRWVLLSVVTTSYFQIMVKLDGRLVGASGLIAYADLPGPRTAIVLTHGAGIDHAVFDPVAAELVRSGHRVVVWDLPGHGQSLLDEDVRFESSAVLNDLAALLDLLGLPRPVVVGHSLGGNLAQALVRRQPERVSGLVVVDSTWNAGPLSRMDRLGLSVAAPLLSLVPARLLPGTMARASAVTPAGLAYAEDRFRRMPKARFLDVWRATASLVAPEPGYRVPVPLALIRGAEDRTGNIASAMPRWAVAEGVDEHVIPAAGHLVSLDAPAAVSAVILDFLAGLPAEGDVAGADGVSR
jgi:pimeloyl-ACP methyl ester carboxylesterase